MKFRKSIFLFAASVVTSGVFACTDFHLSAQDGTHLIGRSMEFADPLQSNLRTSLHNRRFSSTLQNNKVGLNWKAKYGYLYLDGLGANFAIDGMNEQGLSFEFLYLPGETQYQTVPAGKEKQGILYVNFGDWVLSNFKSIDEIKQALNSIYVYAQPLPGFGSIIFPLHAAIHDVTGKGIVVEFVNGKMNVYDYMGVMTNSPQYSWQVTNLRNYLNLTPYNPEPMTIGNYIFSATGQGGGAVGLPGDFTPPSRFVKIAFLLKNSAPTKDANESVNLAQHLLNTVDIPHGAVRDKVPTTHGDYTQWIVIKDMTHKQFYYRFYEDLNIRLIDMTKLDFSENAKPLKMPLVTTSIVNDETKQFLSQT